MHALFFFLWRELLGFLDCGGSGRLKQDRDRGVNHFVLARFDQL